MHLSIVSPVYMAQNIVQPLVEQLTAAAEKITTDFEIILVEDGSADESWTAIEKVAASRPYVKGIRLSRNFGQQFAITAGLTNAKGDFVVVIDCDLQENPVYIVDLYHKILEGNEIVFTEKEKRKHSFFKNITSVILSKVLNFLINDKFAKRNHMVGNFSMLTRKAVNAFLSFNDYRHQYLSVLRWIGFKYDIIKIEHQKRYEGKSSYSLYKLWVLALDGVVSQSDRLLRITVGIGFSLFLIALLSVIGIVIRYIFIKPFMPGWASLATLVIFTGGIIVFCIGICGLYIGKTYEQTKNRPRFIVDETINM